MSKVKKVIAVAILGLGFGISFNAISETTCTGCVCTSGGLCACLECHRSTQAK